MSLLFPTPLMRMRDLRSNWRENRDRKEGLGYPELSTPSFRKAVVTILDGEGLSAAEVVDYLGHENPSLTQDVYMNAIKEATTVAGALAKRLSGLI